MSRLLEDKIAIVTGASRGIGAATARAFADAGATVVLAARTRPELEALAVDIAAPVPLPPRRWSVAMDTEQFRLTTGPASGIRASDADREGMVELLRAHHLEGRLDASEFQARLERSLQAKTLGELRALSADLPQADPRLARGTTAGFRRTAAWRLAVAAAVLAALIVASAFAERPLFFPALPFLFFWSRGFWWYGGWYRRAVIGAQDGGVPR